MADTSREELDPRACARCYLRFDTAKELSVLNEIWALDMIYTNHLLANHRLVFKQLDGAKAIKCYDRAPTPYARTLGTIG
jgi:hypothetical protein